MHIQTLGIHSTSSAFEFPVFAKRIAQALMLDSEAVLIWRSGG
jgi:hypothetical protein